MNAPAFTIGLDFGTSSVRAVVVDCADGNAVASVDAGYASGDTGVLLDHRDPHLARQNPADWLDGLRTAVPTALKMAARTKRFSRDRVMAIGVATTGSTPLPIDANARPLALDPRFVTNLAAHAWLWKDHTSAKEAEAITGIVREHAPQYLASIGGTYSSEWFWAKIWHCLNVAPEVFAAAASWVEQADFIPATLAGARSPADIRRGTCAAGHKAMYSRDWGGLPSSEFLTRLDPMIAQLRDRLFETTYTAGEPAGALCPEWASALGLTPGIPIAIGAFDSHYGAIGSGIAPGTFVKIIGTSTCDIAIAPADRPLETIPGICGTVNGSVLPGYYGMEAGQSAVGDLLHWWTRVATSGRAEDHVQLTADAARLAPGESGLVALDWNNGNRTILVDQRLTGLILGQTLHTTRAEIYRALVEATAFGARAIVERLTSHGVPIDRIVCCGGIAEKNDLFMQIYADVLDRPMLIAGSPQTPALGAAVSAAVMANVHADFAAAQRAMTSLAQRRFTPDPSARRVYDELYGVYRELHDVFGAVPNARADLPSLMKRLLAIRDRVVHSPPTPMNRAASAALAAV